MITIHILAVIIFIICHIRIRNKCKEEGEEFNPIEGSFLEILGYILSLSATILGAILLVVNYLP